MSDLHHDKVLGAQAEHLLKNELLDAAFAEVKQGYIDQCMESQPHDLGLRERLWLAAKVVDDVRATLRLKIADGKLAQRQLNN